jgi:transposase
MDPHKRSATIDVLNRAERVLNQGRFATDAAGYRNMLAVGRTFSDRVWAVEGCDGIGKHLAQRLLADGETVVDVPAKLSARARVFSTGQGRKTDATDAHSIAVVALRTPDLNGCDRTIIWWRCGRWPSAATNSAPPAPPPSAARTGCCWS